MSTMKKYFHRTHGASFVMPNGEILEFTGGELNTDRQDVIKELDKIANVPTSQVFTVEKPIIAQEEATVLTEVVTKAAAAVDGVANVTGNKEPIVAMPINAGANGPQSVAAAVASAQPDPTGALAAALLATRKAAEAAAK